MAWMYTPVVNVAIQVLGLMLLGYIFAASRLVDSSRFIPQMNCMILKLALPAFNVYLLGVQMDLRDEKTWRGLASYVLWVTIIQVSIVLYTWLVTRGDVSEAAFLNLALCANNYGLIGIPVMEATFGAEGRGLSLIMGVEFFLQVVPFSLLAFEWEAWLLQHLGPAPDFTETGSNMQLFSSSAAATAPAHVPSAKHQLDSDLVAHLSFMSDRPSMHKGGPRSALDTSHSRHPRGSTHAPVADPHQGTRPARTQGEMGSSAHHTAAVNVSATATATATATAPAAAAAQRAAQESRGRAASPGAAESDCMVAGPRPDPHSRTEATGTDEAGTDLPPCAVESGASNSSSSSSNLVGLDLAFSDALTCQGQHLPPKLGARFKELLQAHPLYYWGESLKPACQRQSQFRLTKQGSHPSSAALTPSVQTAFPSPPTHMAPPGAAPFLLRRELPSDYEGRDVIRSAAKVAAKTHGGMAKAALRFIRTHEALWHMLSIVMKDPLIWSQVIALVVSLSGLRVFLSPASPQYVHGLGFVAGTLSWLTGITIPLALFGNGVWVYKKNMFKKGTLGKILVLCAMKIAVLPWLMVACTKVCGLGDNAGAAMVLLSITPTATVAFVLAVQYGCGTEIITVVTIVTTCTIAPLVIGYLTLFKAAGVYAYQLVPAGGVVGGTV
ncbi:MAG: hypothetical protein WDW38_002961 [Sanguina aurantia]